MLRAALWLALWFGVANVSEAQQTTKNAFVGAMNTQGLLTIYTGDPAAGNVLTFPGESFLSLRVNGVLYTDNAQIPAGEGSNPPTIFLDFPQTSKILDTLRSVWKEQGFDIVQIAYPVAFANSGVIVTKFEIVNHTDSGMDVQAQYLLDNENSATNSANDAPFFVVDNQPVKNWQNFPPQAFPIFYLALQNPVSSVSFGTVGICYFNDDFPPSPLGLVPYSLIQIGSWPDQVFTPFGPTTPMVNNVLDAATLLMGQSLIATAFEAGVSDSVTEMLRVAYGTPPAALLNEGVNLGTALMSNGLTVFPNPLQNSTTISYSLAERTLVTISVFDALGREVARPVSNVEQNAGENEITLDAHSLKPGVYICRLMAGGVERMLQLSVAR